MTFSPVFAHASPLDISTSLDTSEDILIITEPSRPLAPLGELEEKDGFKIDASFDDQFGIIFESEDTFIEEHSLQEPYVVEFNEVTPPEELIDPISIEFSPNLAPTPPIPSLLSSLPTLPYSLDHLEAIFIECESFVLSSLCLDQDLDDIDIEILKDHFEVKDLTLGYPTGIDFHISFDWLCLGPLPSPLRDVGLY